MSTLFSKPIESTFQSSQNAASYKFLRTLKTTLCGLIKLAQDKFGHLYAIKLSSRKQLRELHRNNCAEDPQEEIRLMTKLRDSPLEGHEYVIKLIDTYVLQKGTDLCDCVVLEFADGGEFFEHVHSYSQKGERMDLTTVHDAFVMLCKGVRFIHMNGIVHLDLSLENILLTKQNVLKICDFGLAKEGRTFKTNSKPGKIPYMAPEVFANKEFDGQKADIWSLGVILWSLLTSLGLYKFPADPDAQFQRLRNGKQGIKELLSAFKVHGIPETVIDLLSGMLNVDPTQRFNIHQVLEHPWVQPSSSLLTSTTMETKSTSTSNHNLNVDVQTVPTIPKEIIDGSTKDDQKVILPPLDDSWSTHHRLIDQFEEKYGKLIAQQEKQQDQSVESSNQVPHPSSESQPTDVTMTEYHPYTTYRSCNPKYAPPSEPTKQVGSRKSTKQVGWKRKTR